jgi:predicted  nucleic acid-binding Zn-ribbon protein
VTPQDIIRAVEALDKNLKQQEAEITRLRTALNFKDIMVEELKSTIRQLEAKLAEKK